MLSTEYTESLYFSQTRKQTVKLCVWTLQMVKTNYKKQLNGNNLTKMYLMSQNHLIYKTKQCIKKFLCKIMIKCYPWTAILMNIQGFEKGGLLMAY